MNSTLTGNCPPRSEIICAHHSFVLLTLAALIRGWFTVGGCVGLVESSAGTGHSKVNSYDGGSLFCSSGGVDGTDTWSNTESANKSRGDFRLTCLLLLLYSCFPGCPR